MEVIARGRTRKLHLGCAIDEATGAKRYFFLMAGIGLDAEVVKRVRPGLKKRIGKAAFWYSGLGHLADWEPVPFEIKVGDETFPRNFCDDRKGGSLWWRSLRHAASPDRPSRI